MKYNLSISLYSWSIIVSIAEHKSIHQAARALNLTPSAVSHMLKKIETNLGYSLFVRERNRFELTDNGKLLYPYIQNHLKSGKALEEESLRLKNSTEGAVCLAAYSNVIARWMPDLIKRFNDKYPLVKITIRQANDVRIREWMENGEIDLAIAFNDYHRTSAFIPLLNSPIVCFTPPDYKPRNGTYMTAEDLRDLPILHRSRNFDEATNVVLIKAGIPLESLYRIDNDQACSEFIKKGFGFRLATVMSISNTADINMYPIEGASFRTLGVLTAMPEYISPTVKLFRDEVVNFFSEMENQ